MASAAISTGLKAVRLYRTILRLHRAVLPQEMRLLGDAYVR